MLNIKYNYYREERFKRKYNFFTETIIVTMITVIKKQMKPLQNKILDPLLTGFTLLKCFFL